MSRRDHFSGHAACYAKARPRYPEELFAWLSERAPGHALAWDAGAGNGQASIALARHFRRVHASDASALQIAEAPAHPKVRYVVEPAERCSLEDGSADLALVAQALHWFDVRAYFDEVKRVLREGGVFAALTYANARVDDAVDAVVARLYGEVLRPHWPPERAHVESRYDDFAFPLSELPVDRSFDVRASLDLEGFLLYLSSWSAARRFAEMEGHDPVEAHRAEIAAAWGPSERARDVRWPLTVKCRINVPR